MHKCSDVQVDLHNGESYVIRDVTGFDTNNNDGLLWIECDEEGQTDGYNNAAMFRLTDLKAVRTISYNNVGLT